MSEQQSIKQTLNVIRKALEEDKIPNINSKNENEKNNNNNILVLNKLIKSDGTIKLLNKSKISKDETINILEKKLDQIFDKYLVNWLDKNLPKYLEKYFKNK